AVRHPNVVQVYESGGHDDRPYLVLEYCPGRSLADRLKGGARLPPRAAADLLRRIADGVAAVHAVGIIHRDLKPGNILFGGPVGGTAEPKVADFGLARRGTGAGLTQSLALLGTPQYMSPEQAELKARFVGPPSDVWALGVILYECLAGTRPFTADTADAVLERVRTETPAPLRPQVADLSRDLDLIVGKCLEKDAADRYPTAAELAADLGRFVRGEPISVRPAGRVERAAKWVRRKPTAAAAWGFSGLAVALALVVGVVAGFWREAEAARGTAVVALENETEAKKTIQALLATESGLRGRLEVALKGETEARGQLDASLLRGRRRRRGSTGWSTPGPCSWPTSAGGTRNSPPPGNSSRAPGFTSAGGSTTTSTGCATRTS
ncbi:MAG TPA: serine/threonine-protein kinase, partial [Urbifossiella sp.]|nr:serine/threonine-protein kinase [Urbifossiella sp.]